MIISAPGSLQGITFEMGDSIPYANTEEKVEGRVLVHMVASNSNRDWVTDSDFVTPLHESLKYYCRVFNHPLEWCWFKYRGLTFAGAATPQQVIPIPCADH